MDLFRVRVILRFMFYLSDVDQHLDGIDVAEFIVVIIWDFFIDQSFEY